jgi:hypothetical protein
MYALKQYFISVGLVASVCATPVFAASSAASSASDAASTSVGQMSNSVGTSSNSSSKATGMAAGDYKITEVAFVPERPGVVRMQLQAVATSGTEGQFFLYVPTAAAEASRLVQGDIVIARERSYGMEFANGTTKAAFFLAVNDEMFRELQTKPVSL